MPVVVILHERDTATLDRVSHDRQWLLAAGCRGQFQDVANFRKAVAVDFPGLPTKRLPLVTQGSQRHDLLTASRRLPFVVINKHREGFQLLGCGKHGRLPHAPFVALPVTKENHRAVVSLLNSRRQCHANTGRKAVTKGAGRPLYAGSAPRGRLFRQGCPVFSVVHEQRFREKPFSRKHGIKSRGGMTFAENQTIPVGRVGLCRTNPQEFPVQPHQQIHTGER